MRSSEFTPTWHLLVSSHDKTHWGDELIQLVQSAYKYTDLGSFVNTLNDVQRSDWLVLDLDQDNRQDCAVFYRTNRSSETWVGNKIQGIGHNRLPDSKKYAVSKVANLLTKDGWWIESNAVGKSVGSVSGAAPLTDKSLLQQLFPNTELRMINNNGAYERKLPTGKLIQEIVYGRPRLK